MSTLAPIPFRIATAAFLIPLVCMLVASVAHAKGIHGGAMVMHSAPMKSGPSVGHRYWRYGYGPAYVVTVSPCADYLAMWRRTGSMYWRAKYEVCMGR